MPFQRAKRLDLLPTYLFVEIDRKKRAALAAGRDVIDFGIGDPDRPTPSFIVDRMAQAIRDPANHRYPTEAGVPEFRDTVTGWFHERFGVKLDAKSELFTLIGSKEGLGHLPLAVINPGDVALVPNPGYPVYTAATLFAGGQVHEMPLTAERGFLPDLDAIDAATWQKTKLLFINYPNNPTGAVAPLDFYRRCVELAHKHDFVVCSDAAYCEMYYDPADKPHSILEINGAKEVSIELHSFSKTFNMTGWRVAFAVGHPEILAALAKVKSNMDSGVFNAVQHAALAALRRCDGPEVAELRTMYKTRRDRIVPALQRCGFEVQPPRATFYVWARCPKGYDSMRCSAKLLDEADIVAVPGVGFGRHGDAFVRFALTVEAPRIDQAADRLAKLKW